MVNRIMIIGRLGKDPEVRYTQSGKAVCSFSVATDDGYGEQKATTWHDVEAWDKAAEACGQYLRKGSLVYCEGRLKKESYEDKDGNKRQSVRISASRVQFLDPPSGQRRQSGDPGEYGRGGTDDDVPF